MRKTKFLLIKSFFLGTLASFLDPHELHWSNALSQKVLQDLHTHTESDKIKLKEV